jgi:hypothetical protein
MATKAQLETQIAELTAQNAALNSANANLTDENNFLLNQIKVAGRKTLWTRVQLWWRNKVFEASRESK